MATKTTKTVPSTPKTYIVYDPNCGCSPIEVEAPTPGDAAKKFCDEQGEDLSDVTQLRIIEVANIPLYDVKATFTVTAAKTPAKPKAPTASQRW